MAIRTGTETQRDMDASGYGPGTITRTPFVDVFFGSTRIPLQGATNSNSRASGDLPGDSESSPFMLIDFNYKLSSTAGVGNEVAITILDPNWDALEQLVAASISQQREISFQFGWRGIDDKVGRNIKGLLIHDYTASYFPFQGTQINLIAIDKNVRLTHGRRTRSFSPTASIPDVIRSIYADIDPTIVVKIDPIVNSVGDEHRLMANMTPLEYIKELLVIAKSPTGSSKFNWVTEVNEEGQTIVRILADNPQSIAVRQYLVGRDIKGEMVNFTPQVLGSALLTLGGGRSDAVSVDPLTGAARRVSSTTQEVGVGLADKTIHKVPSIPNGIHELPYSNIDDLKGFASEFRSRADNYMNNATAVLYGDPGIKPFDQIEVLVLKSDVPGVISELSDRSLVHTSGVYRVFTVEHMISAGSFSTMLELYRESSFIGDGENTLRLPVYLRPETNEEIRVEPTPVDPING